MARSGRSHFTVLVKKSKLPSRITVLVTLGSGGRSKFGGLYPSSHIGIIPSVKFVCSYSKPRRFAVSEERRGGLLIPEYPMTLPTNVARMTITLFMFQEMLFSTRLSAEPKVNEIP